MIELQGLSKTYRGAAAGRPVPALDDVSVRLHAGEVVGIAGPNGAGKSTLLSLLLGFLRPTRGTARVAALPPREYVERHGAAYLAELPALPPRWTVESTLARGAALAGVPAGARRGRIELMLESLGLAEQRSRQVRQLSKGNLQRLGLAQALVGDSDFVVLDEPTHGLDPVWTQRFRDLVRDLRRPGRLLLIASHNLDELERVADRVLILNQGRLDRVVDVGAAAGATAAAAPVTYRLVLAEPHSALAELFPDAVSIEGRLAEWRISGPLAELNRKLASLVARNATIVAFAPERGRLESEFRAALGGGGDG
ncbi:MAG TPA: ABC transporter ATP-binding protein [Gemmatimonadales bacterium]|nr:ABC transporter ATP-binding protein [Gemmatimonadales bacterium]